MMWQSILKRGLDIIVSGVALFLLGPILLLIALAIRLDSPGPALFRQKRLGKGGASFEIYKFRTMLVGAPDLRNPDGSTQQPADDPRLTRVGRILRQASLDELPQLINVLRGEMSLVGPRPDQVDQLNYYTPEERRKLAVKPGITGLAQVSGRNAITWEQRKRLDLDYVERASLGLDLRILLKTLPTVLLQRGVFTSVATNQGNGEAEDKTL